MKLHWSSKAIQDLDRLHDFLAEVNPPIAAKTVQGIVSTPKKLLEHPRLGNRLDEFSPREVRRLLIGNYELRYELRNDDIFVLRIWHTRENR